MNDLKPRSPWLAGWWATCLLPVASAQFAPPVTILPAGQGVRELLWIDVDGDSLEDLVFAEAQPARLSFARRAAPGVFEAPRTLLPHPNGIVDAALADVDDDGDLDLVYVDNLKIVHALLGTATGLSGLPIALGQLPDRVYALQVGDANGDGVSDVFVASGIVTATQVHLLLNDGQGNFGAPTQVTPSPRSKTEDFRVADFDGDGAVDVIVPWSEGPHFVRNDGTGAFAPPAPLPWTPLAQPHRVVVADLDGDLDPDLVVPRISQQPAAIYENLGSGAFAIRSDVPTTAGLASDAVVADLDGDGRMDLTVFGSFEAVTHRGLGPFSFAAGEPTSTDPSANAYEVLLADVDGDGAKDILGALRYVPIGAGWVPNTRSPNGPVLGSAIPLHAASPGIAAAVNADFDGDGRAEVLVARYQPVQLLVHRGLPQGPFTTEGVSLPHPRTVVALAAGDFNGDAHVDLAAVDDLGAVLAFSAVAPLQFGPPVVVGQAAGTPQLRVIDLDRDGDDDILCHAPAGALVWFECRGDGTFAAASVLEQSAGTLWSFDVADLDGDMDLDIVVARHDVSGVSACVWLEQTSAGFGSAVVLSTALTTAVVGVDVDVDGVLDVVLGGTNSLTWCRGLGAGAFDAPAYLQVSYFPVGGLFAHDLNLDGAMDLVMTPSFSFNEQVYILRNLGGGTFGYNGSLGTSVSVLLIWDQDGDGDKDVLSVFGVLARVYENLTQGLVGGNYCGPAVPTVQGRSAVIRAVGSEAVSANSLTLRAQDVTYAGVGFFLCSRVGTPPFPVPNSVGRLCLGGAIGRFVGPGQVGVGPEMQLRLDLTALPSPTGPTAAQVGETWHFQAWFRDRLPTGAATSNFTDGIAVTFQ